MHTRTRMSSPVRTIVAGRIALAGAIFVVSGCAAPPGKAGSVDAAMTEYNAQQYGEAQQQASKAMAKSTGTQRERAAYIAGLSAYQAGDAAAADRELSVAAVSSDPQISGNAKAMLGQLRLDQRRPREAAGYFADASRLLTGEDARQAAWHAGLAYRQAGDEANAKRWLNQASGSQYDPPAPSSNVLSNSSAKSPPVNAAPPKTSAASAVPASNVNARNAASGGSGGSGGATKTPTPAPLPDTQVATVGFTLQIGAFNDKKRARTAAEEAEALARKEGLGRVRIIPRRDARGQPMYVVHVGWWVTRNEATAARGKLGRLEYIVAPAPAG